MVFVSLSIVTTVLSHVASDDESPMVAHIKTNLASSLNSRYRSLL